ncbi:hypothetical protein SSTU70S_03702 [Stutzerimonas stutzeri]
MDGGRLCRLARQRASRNAAPIAGAPEADANAWVEQERLFLVGETGRTRRSELLQLVKKSD